MPGKKDRAQGGGWDVWELTARRDACIINFPDSLLVSRNIESSVKL